jgi:GT2 family glycosyltransferase
LIRRRRETQPATAVLDAEPQPHPVETEVPRPPKTSVIVVSHNRLPFLRRCLETLEASQDRDVTEVIVVDNGSTDGSSQLESEFSAVYFIKIPRNFGLTKALNLGIRAAKGEYLLLLHEDTEVAPDVIRKLVQLLDLEVEAGAACPLLVTRDGSPAPQLDTLPPTFKWKPAEDTGEPLDVEYPRGAALMVKPFYLGAMKKIDERYGQFGSDAEIALQLGRARKKILLHPQARVVHHGGKTDPERAADCQLGRAAFLGKYKGFGAWLRAVIGASLSALAGFRIGELMNILSGKKIDGKS